MATGAVEETTAESQEATTSTEESSQPTNRRAKQIKIAGLLVGLTVVMVVIGYLFMPPPPEAGDADTTEAQASEDSGSEEGGVEIEVHDFNCTNDKAGEGIITHIRFKLVVLVPSKLQYDFKDAKVIHENRLREAIIRVARSASANELADPHLSTIKRLFREEINKILRVSYVTEVIISDWTTMQR